MIKPADKELLKLIGDAYNNDGITAFEYLCVKYAFRLNTTLNNYMATHNISYAEALKVMAFNMCLEDSMASVIENMLDLQKFIRSKNDLLNW